MVLTRYRLMKVGIFHESPTPLGIQPTQEPRRKAIAAAQITAYKKYEFRANIPAKTSTSSVVKHLTVPFKKEDL